MTLVKKLTILVNLDTLVSVNRTAAKLMSVWAVEIGVISMNEFGGSNAHTKRAGKLLIGNIVLQKWPSFSIHITAYLCAKKLLFRDYKQPYSVLNDNVLIILNMGQSRPLFCLLSSPPPHHKSITNWKKHRWSAWNSNPGPQDGRRRRNHGAMASTHVLITFTLKSLT